jgi:hypothetical protein
VLLLVLSKCTCILTKNTWTPILFTDSAMGKQQQLYKITIDNSRLTSVFHSLRDDEASNSASRPEGKRPLGRPRRRWEDNIKNDLGETRINGVNWIRPTLNRGWWRLLWARWWTFGFHKESRLLFDKLIDYQLFKEFTKPWSN